MIKVVVLKKHQGLSVFFQTTGWHEAIWESGPRLIVGNKVAVFLKESIVDVEDSPVNFAVISQINPLDPDSPSKALFDDQDSEYDGLWAIVESEVHLTERSHTFGLAGYLYWFDEDTLAFDRLEILSSMY